MKREKQKTNYSEISNIAYVMRALAADEGKIIYALLALCGVMPLVQNAIGIAIPAAAVWLYGHEYSLAQYAAALALLAAAYAASMVINTRASEEYSIHCVLSRGFTFNRRMLFKVLETDYQSIESHEGQKRVGAAQEALDANMIGVERVMREIPIFISNMLGLIVYGSVVLTVDARILVVLLLMLVFNVRLNKFARDYMNNHLEEDAEIRRKQRYISGLSGKTVNLTAGKDIRLYRMEGWFGEIMRSYTAAADKWQRRVEKRYYLPVASDTVFIALRDGLAYVILIHMVANGEITLAAFIALLGVVSNFSTWLFGVTKSRNAILDARKLVDNCRSFLDKKDITKKGGIAADISQGAPEIELRDVSFRYDDGGENILSHINLKIRRGEKLALVGNNGAGKTTLVKLLCGFYQPTEGEILVGGVKISDYDISSYFKLLGVVFQDTEDLSFNLIECVSAKPEEETDMERFWDAVQKAGLKEKIDLLENGAHTYLNQIFDDNGIKLSGGEMQKLMLARCIYKNAPFMILDEPTAALDPLAESAMYEEYHRLTADKTSIFISHRLASTRFCDRIIFLENGGIAEEGTHDELMERGGRYAELYGIQSSYYNMKRNSNAV